MKIGIDARLWNETGVGRYIRNLVRYLQILDKRNEYVLFVRSQDYESIKFKVQSSKFKVIGTSIRWHSLEEQVKFPSILNREKLDLVHFPYFSVPVFYNKPFVVTIHDLIIHNFPTGEASTLPLPIYKIKLLGYKYIISKIAKKAKRIIVPTNSVKEEVVKILKVPKEKIEVTYEGIDKEISNIKNQRSKINNELVNKKYFLYVGNAYPHKNLQRLIDAFMDLKKDQEYKDISLLLVGRNDYFYRKLERKIEKDSIKILHNINDKELSYLYKNAIALIIPSLMEGFGLTALEAMNNRCLVLASDIPALHEVCQDTALYFNPLDTKEIKEKMRNVCFNSLNHLSRYIEEGFERSKQFSWRTMAEETLKIYESSISL